MPYQPNPGHMQEECLERDEYGDVTGYRAVRGLLFGGFDSKREGHPPWPAGNRRQPSTSWTISRPPHPFEIKEFEVI